MQEEHSTPTESPLWQATTEELVQEFQRRFPLGFMYLTRPSSDPAYDEVVAPYWGDPRAVFGAMVHLTDTFRVRGLGTPNRTRYPFPDTDPTAFQRRRRRRDGDQD